MNIIKLFEPVSIFLLVDIQMISINLLNHLIILIFRHLKSEISTTRSPSARFNKSKFSQRLAPTPVCKTWLNNSQSIFFLHPQSTKKTIKLHRGSIKIYKYIFSFSFSPREKKTAIYFCKRIEIFMLNIHFFYDL